MPEKMCSTQKKPVCKAILFTLFGVLFQLSIGYASTQQNKTSLKTYDNLWDKAVTHLSENRWVPGRIIERELISSNKCEPIELNTTEMVLEKNKGEMIAIRLIRAKQNCEDITEAKRSETEAHFHHSRLDEDSPFNTNNQGLVNAHCVNRFKTINETECVAFQFTFNHKKTPVTGIAWLNQTTGVPALVISETIAVPFESDGVRFTKLVETEHFRTLSENKTIIQKSVIEAVIEKKSLLYDFNGHVASESVYSDHFKLTDTKKQDISKGKPQ